MTGLQNFNFKMNFPHGDWENFLSGSQNVPNIPNYMMKMNKFIENEIGNGHTIFPALSNVFSSMKACSPKDVKVVIIGQDPYSQPDQAHGLAFSVLPGTPIPPTLRNIYQELENNKIGFQKPDHGYLMGWAEQGVLLLNRVLTVRDGEPNSHENKGWEILTDALISRLSTYRSNLVFMLWGKKAQSVENLIDKSKHYVLTAPHPSPMSAFKGFFGCNHFALCNQYLISNGITPIDWNYLPCPPLSQYLVSNGITPIVWNYLPCPPVIQ